MTCISPRRIANSLALLIALLFLITSCFQPVTPPTEEFVYDESDEISLTEESR